jgi:hypothetical protein
MAPNPNPLIRGADPWIQIPIRISTKISRIPNTAFNKRCDFLFQNSCPVWRAQQQAKGSARSRRAARTSSTPTRDIWRNFNTLAIATSDYKINIIRPVWNMKVMKVSPVFNKKGILGVFSSV